MRTKLLKCMLTTQHYTAEEILWIRRWAAVNLILRNITCWCTIRRPSARNMLCNISVKRVYKTRCLRLTITEHVNDILVSFARKLNLLKSMQFLPKPMLQDVCNKVFLPSVTYGILVWGSCNVTLFDRLGKQRKSL